MNLTTIDLGNAGVAGKDPTTFSAPSAGEPAGNASSGFGQWMAQALERIDVNGNSLQTLEVSAGAQPLQTGKDGDQIMTPGHDAVLLPPWMQAWPTGLAVEQVGTGADLQVITARSPDPDTASLMAFAQAQGMDPHAIALLLGQEPGTPANTAASPAASSTPTLAASPVTPLMAAPTAASSGQAVAGNPIPPTGIATPTEITPPPLPQAWLGSVTAWQDALPDARATQTDAATAATAAEPVNGVWLSSLRWAQPLAAKAVNARAPDTAPSTPPQVPDWTESELDLGALMTEQTTPLPEDLASGIGAPSQAISPHTGPAEGAGMARQSTSPSLQRPDASPAQASSQITSDQAQVLSEKMADAIGERMIREIERGHWSLRLMLKPAHLGHIEVEMRLHAGELDASFTAPQAATRDLLQDGLSRLKETLSQMGMDVANLDVKTGQNRQNGGNPTSGQGQTAQTTANAETAETPPATSGFTPRPHRPDGWDVMV